LRKENVVAKRILVVDDNKSILSILKHWLAKAGYEAHATEHPRQAHEMAVKNNYDLIIVDIMMAEMDGVQVMRQLDADAKTKEVPIMVITALSAQNSTIEKAKDLFDDFLTKPFHKEELLEKVGHALMARTSAQASS
jgi:DNA-binding response OmpR family regulator